MISGFETTPLETRNTALNKGVDAGEYSSVYPHSVDSLGPKNARLFRQRNILARVAPGPLQLLSLNNNHLKKNLDSTVAPCYH